ncbi:MAG: WYL domain-containing protein [Pirellulaceae bacterium]
MQTTASIEVIRTIQQALLETKQVRARYESPYEEEPFSLTLHVYRLCLIKRAWYVIGHIDGEQEPKPFGRSFQGDAGHSISKRQYPEL